MPAPDWTPSTTDVAALLHARTKTSGGEEAGDFTDETRPTGDEVDVLIARAADNVAARIGELGDNCQPDRVAGLKDDAGSMAAIRAAMLVEASFFPEQLGSDRSPYNALKELYDEGMKALVESVGETCGGGEGEAVGGEGQDPESNFDDRTLIGPQTIW